jgi:hypothetical protein
MLTHLYGCVYAAHTNSREKAFTKWVAHAVDVYNLGFLQNTPLLTHVVCVLIAACQW